MQAGLDLPLGEVPAQGVAPAVTDHEQMEDVVAAGIGGQVDGEAGEPASIAEFQAAIDAALAR